MNEGGADARRREKAWESRPDPDVLIQNELVRLKSEENVLVDGKKPAYRTVCRDYRPDMVWVGPAELTPQDVDKFTRDCAEAMYGLNDPQIQLKIMDMGLKRVPISDTQKLLDS
jgi:hypothetical protein